MIHISLFSGIGGFDLAAEWMGWKNVVSCDINEFGNRVREYYWPEAYHHRDIKTLTYETINNELSGRFGNDWRNDEIILTGGFPCQPFSVAGKQLGTEDDRHLWPEMLRVIREVSPKWIVGENVRGLVNWSGGLVFDQVQADLEAEGYEVLPFMVPACAVDAPHRRDRIWFIAYRNSPRFQKERTQQPTAGTTGGSFQRTFTDTGKQQCDDGGNNREERHLSGNVNGDAQKNKSERDGRVGGAGSIGETTENPVGSGRLYGEHEQEGSEDGQQREPGAGDSDRVCISEGATTDPLRGRHGGGTKETGSDTEQERSMDQDFGQHGDGVRSETKRCSEVTPNAQSERSERFELGGEPETCRQKQGKFGGSDSEGVTTNANGFGWRGESDRVGESGQFNKTSEGSHWQDFPTQPPVCNGDDGLSARLDRITFSKWRQESIKAGGNAVVPQVVFEIFKAIEAFEK